MAEPMAIDAEVRARNRRSGLRWSLLVLLMVALTPPLYLVGDLLCDRAGIGMDPGGDAAAAVMLRPGEEGVATGRYVKSQHNATVAKPLEGLVVFSVDQPSQRTEVGRYYRVTYRLRSVAERTLYIRPMHFVSDEKASRAFLMIECFCYNDMALHPGQTVELPVVYGFNPEMDPLVSGASITYTLYPITRSEMRAKVELDASAPIQHPDAVRNGEAQQP
jgi:cytochrome c oxidase assembly protein Cox11